MEKMPDTSGAEEYACLTSVFQTGEMSKFGRKKLSSGCFEFDPAGVTLCVAISTLTGRKNVPRFVDHLSSPAYNCATLTTSVDLTIQETSLNVSSKFLCRMWRANCSSKVADLDQSQIL